MGMVSLNNDQRNPLLLPNTELDSRPCHLEGEGVVCKAPESPQNFGIHLNAMAGLKA